VEHWEPNDTLRFPFHPSQKMNGLVYEYSKVLTKIKYFLYFKIKKQTQMVTSMDCRCFPALSKQHLTDGSMFDPPNAATSPNSRGI
jgi:hypothetical protein